MKFDLRSAKGQREWLNWAEKSIQNVSKDKVISYWEKSQPRIYTEAIKGIGKEQVAAVAMRWATGEIMKGYETGEYFQDLKVNNETFESMMKDVEPVIFREHKKAAGWLKKELKKTDVKFFDWVEVNGGDIDKARYLGNEGTNVWYEIPLAVGYINILYSYTDQSILDIQHVGF